MDVFWKLEHPYHHYIHFQIISLHHVKIIIPKQYKQKEAFVLAANLYNCYFQEIEFSLLRQMLFQKVSVSRLSYGSVIRKFYIFN